MKVIPGEQISQVHFRKLVTTLIISIIFTLIVLFFLYTTNKNTPAPVNIGPSDQVSIREDIISGLKGVQPVSPEVSAAIVEGLKNAKSTLTAEQEAEIINGLRSK